jgi:hypothetical protein
MATTSQNVPKSGGNRRRLVLDRRCGRVLFGEFLEGTGLRGFGTSAAGDL